MEIPVFIDNWSAGAQGKQAHLNYVRGQKLDVSLTFSFFFLSFLFILMLFDSGVCVKRDTIYKESGSIVHIHGTHRHLPNIFLANPWAPTFFTKVILKNVIITAAYRSRIQDLVLRTRAKSSCTESL